MFKFILGRSSVTQSYHRQSSPSFITKKSTKKRENYNKKVSKSKGYSLKKGYNRRRNRLNYSWATYQKIRRTLDTLYIYQKHRTKTLGSKPGYANFGYLYKFFLPKECLHTTQSINRDVFSPMLENLVKNYGCKLYCWCVKHNSNGNPFYLFYTSEHFGGINLNANWLIRIQKYFHYDDTIKLNPDNIEKFSSFDCIENNDDFFCMVKMPFLAYNRMPFSACKRYIEREYQIFRSFGRSSVLSDNSKNEQFLDKQNSEIFEGQLIKNSLNVRREKYYTTYFLNRDTEWFQKKYTPRLNEEIYNKLKPRY